MHKAVSYIIESQNFNYEIIDFEGALHGYKMIYNPNHPSETYKKRIDKKINKIYKIIEIGKKCAMMYENTVYRACKQKYNDAKRSKFNSSDPDIIIPSKKLLVEASARYENPIDINYILGKMTRYYHKYPNYKIIFIAPNIDENAYKFILRSNKLNYKKLEEEHILKSKFIKYPKKDISHEGFPIFSKYKFYLKTLREVGRKGCLVNTKQMINDIKKVI